MFTQENNKVKTAQNNHQVLSLNWSKKKTSRVNQVSVVKSKIQKQTESYATPVEEILSAHLMCLENSPNRISDFAVQQWPPQKKKYSV